MIIIKSVIFILLIGLFLYSKMLPHATLLNPNAMKYFSFLDKLFKPTCSFVSRTLPTKWEIGYNGLKLDFGQIIVFTLLLIIYRSI